MGILDFFKRKKVSKKEIKEKETKKEIKKAKEKKEEKKEKLEKREESKEKEFLSGLTKIEDEVIFHLIKPHITEKSSFLQSQNKYTFWVRKSANKVEIKKAVEKLYKVNVIKVNIINPKEKTIRRGFILGRRPVYKKAIVTLKEGQRIEI